MSYCSPQQLLTFLNRERNGNTYTDYGSHLPWAAAGERLGVDYPKEHGWTSVPLTYTRELVTAALEIVHENVAEGRFLEWKSLRPWVVTNVTAGLDTTKNWIGWEVETGWQNQDARKEVITAWANTYRYTCTDNEGYGSYPVELTIAPQTPTYYRNSRTPVHPLLFICDYADKAELHGPGRMVGTHVNFSSPAFRAGSAGLQEWVEMTLNASIGTLSREARGELFGRSNLYAGFFRRGGEGASDESTSDASAWIEGKLFNSTYDKDIAKGYIKVGERIADVMEMLALQYPELLEKASLAGARYLEPRHVNNFYALLSGVDEPLDLSATRTGYSIYGDSIGEDEEDDWDDDGNPPPNGEWERGGETWCSSCNEYH